MPFIGTPVQPVRARVCVCACTCFVVTMGDGGGGYYTLANKIVITVVFLTERGPPPLRCQRENKETRGKGQNIENLSNSNCQEAHNSLRPTVNFCMCISGRTGSPARHVPFHGLSWKVSDQAPGAGSSVSAKKKKNTNNDAVITQASQRFVRCYCLNIL